MKILYPTSGAVMLTPLRGCKYLQINKYIPPSLPPSFLPSFLKPRSKPLCFYLFYHLSSFLFDLRTLIAADMCSLESTCVYEMLYLIQHLKWID